MLGLQIVYIIFSGNSGAWGKINEKYWCLLWDKVYFIPTCEVAPVLSSLCSYVLASFCYFTLFLFAVLTWNLRVNVSDFAFGLKCCQKTCLAGVNVTHRLPLFAWDTVHAPHHSLPGSSTPPRPPSWPFEISVETFLENSQCTDTQTNCQQ